MKDCMMAAGQKSSFDLPQSQQMSNPSALAHSQLDFASDCDGLSPQTSSFIEPSLKRQRLEEAEELSMPSASYSSLASLEDGEIIDTSMQDSFDTTENIPTFSYEDMFAFDDEEEDEPKLKIMENEESYSLGDHLIDSDAFIEPDSHLSQQDIKLEDYDNFDGCLSTSDKVNSQAPSTISSPASVSVKQEPSPEEDEEDEEDEDFEMDPEELDTMLDEGLQGYSKGRKRKAVNSEGNQKNRNNEGLQERQKVILIEKGKDPFDILPESWVIITHNSGMPVYLHRQTRVCTLSRPYFLGPGSARKHDIPASAIPCFHYRKALDREQNDGNTPPTECPVQHNDAAKPTAIDNSDQSTASAMPSTSTSPTPSLTATPATTSQSDNTPQNGATTSSTNSNQVKGCKVESAETLEKENNLDFQQVREYCSKLFQFETITIRKYKTWKERRNHMMQMKRASRPTLPANTKLITIPVQNDNNSMSTRSKEFIFNPAGKTEICILHEYAQHALRVQPKYIFKEIENGKTPYGATVVINNVHYGTGYASSKKAAKLEAAKASLKILIPDLEERTVESASKEPEKTETKEVPSEKPAAPPTPAPAETAEAPASAANGAQPNPDASDLSFFDEIKIEDPRVTELCTKVGQPTPYQLLLDCLKRNFGLGDTEIKVEMKPLKHQRSEFTMKVGKHEAKITCKNKREGRHRAAQSILQKLHPHISTWGSLLRLYNWREVFKEKKAERKTISELQAGNNPNKAILGKLKQEMMKLYDRKKQGEKMIDGRPQFLSEVRTAELVNIDIGSLIF